MEIIIDNIIISKLQKFSKKRLQNNVYIQRGSPNSKKVYEDILTGAIGEYGAYLYLKNLNINVTEPDLNLYDKKEKSFNADLECDNNMYHVKSQSVISSQRYGNSWLLQKTDPVVCSPKVNEYFIFTEVDGNKVKILKKISCKFIKENKLYKKTKLNKYNNNKVAIYLKDLKGIKLSYSGLEKYKTCPRMYRLHYIDRIRTTDKSSALLFGNAIDESLNILLQEKDLQKSIGKFENLMNQWKDDESVNFFKSDYIHNKSGWDSLYIRGLEFIEKYNKEIIPNIEKVIDVQTEIKKVNQFGDTIIGFADFIVKWKDDDFITVVDNKTSSKSYSKKMIETSRQLALYAWALDYENISYVVMRKDLNSKGQIRPIQILNHKIDKKLVEEVLQEVDYVLQSIKNEEFEPTKNISTCKFMFGKKCPYFDLCHHNKTVEECDNLERK